MLSAKSPSSSTCNGQHRLGGLKISMASLPFLGICHWFFEIWVGGGVRFAYASFCVSDDGSFFSVNFGPELLAVLLDSLACILVRQDDRLP